MDLQQTEGQTDGHIDDQHETIIPCHYCVDEYKKYLARKIFDLAKYDKSS